MLYRLDQWLGWPIVASDGDIGRLKDVYFDDHRWTVRYLVVETGEWLSGRKVLIPAVAVQSIDRERRVALVQPDRQQVKASPPIDADQPVSRQHETELLDHYGYPYYWRGPLLWGATAYTADPLGLVPPVSNAPGKQGEAPIDPHLRSANEVTGYHLQTTHDPLGHIEDFLLDTANWAIRYLVVDTCNWLPGRHVVIPPQWIKGVDWTERVVNVGVTRDVVETAPEYHSDLDFSRAYAANLYRHYQRPAGGRPAK
jgi:sporulation protein YlmC with PRC-barrel domain